MRTRLVSIETSEVTVGVDDQNVRGGDGAVYLQEMVSARSSGVCALVSKKPTCKYPSPPPPTPGFLHGIGAT